MAQGLYKHYAGAIRQSRPPDGRRVIAWLPQSGLREVCTCGAVDVLIEDRAVWSGTQRPVLQGWREPKANAGVDLTADNLANLTLGRWSELALMQQV